jgi:electron transport complex protein RnfC
VPGFRGGIHPPGSKKLTRGKRIEDAPIPEHLAVPMIQHLGGPAKPKVAKGDEVKKGQLVGEATGFVSANVHSPVSGKVSGIEERPIYQGIEASCVLIENDGREEWADGMNVERDASSLSPKEIVDVVFDAGVVGMGGATFPTHVKLTPPDDVSIDVVILNGAECEPYQTCDHRLMLETPQTIIEGLRLVMRAVSAERGFVGIEANKPDAIREMSRAAASIENVTVASLAACYPQGAEKQLIKALTGREVPAGGLPLHIGVVVQNVGTAHAVYEAVIWGRPLIQRVVTVTGDCVSRPGNYLVRVGESASELLEHAGVRAGMRKLIAGGPMMGIAQRTAEFPVAKGVTSLLTLAKAEPSYWQACIRCGRCVDVCPMGLLPCELSILIEGRRYDEAAKANVQDCFECGCCTYVCPARRPIVQMVKLAKAELAKAKKQEEHATKG